MCTTLEARNGQQIGLFTTLAVFITPASAQTTRKSMSLACPLDNIKERSISPFVPRGGESSLVVPRGGEFSLVVPQGGESSHIDSSSHCAPQERVVSRRVKFLFIHLVFVKKKKGLTNTRRKKRNVATMAPDKDPTVARRDEKQMTGFLESINQRQLIQERQENRHLCNEYIATGE